jgi:hypothetical protein
MHRATCVTGMIAMGLFAACGESDQDASAIEASQRKPGPKCGSETCELPPELEGQRPCCMDPFRGGCGVRMSGTCRPLPKIDVRCPLPMFSTVPRGPGTMVVGCCTEDQECGFDFGLGCQPRQTACDLVGFDEVDSIMPMTCEGTPLPLPVGCGQNGLMTRRPRIPVAGGGG